MRTRTAGGIAITCAIVVLGAAAIASAAPKRHVLKGSTHQGQRIMMRSGHGSVDVLRFSIKLRCRDGSTLTDTESGFLPTPVHGGKFRDRQFGSTDKVVFKGSVKGHLARGKIRVTDKLPNGVRCASRWVGFTARAHR